MGDITIADGVLIDLIGAAQEQDVYDAVAEAVHGLLPGSVVVVSRLDREEQAFRVSATRGMNKNLAKLAKILGLDPTTRAYPVADMRPEDVASYRSGRIELVPEGLHALSMGAFPKPASAAVERLLSVDRIYVVGFAWGDFHYGSVSIGLRRDQELASVDSIETLVHQATIAIRRLQAERELQERTAELDVFFSESLDLLAVADMDGHFRRVNPQWQETLGFTAEELTSTRFFDFVHPDDIGPTEAAVARLAEGKAETRFVNRYRTRSGDYRYLEWRAFPRGDLIYAAARDLTDRIEAEEALRTSEARYRLIAENTADVIWVLDIASGRFSFVSPSVERLRGYSVEEVLQQTMDEVAHPGVPCTCHGATSGSRRHVRGRRRVGAHPRQRGRPAMQGGRIVSTEVTTTLLKNADGSVDRVLGVSRDITERREAEAKIRELNESLEARVERAHRPTRGGDRGARGVQLLGVPRPARTAARHQRLRDHPHRGPRRRHRRRRASLLRQHHRQHAAHGAAHRRSALVLPARPVAPRARTRRHGRPGAERLR